MSPQRAGADRRPPAMVDVMRLERELEQRVAELDDVETFVLRFVVLRERGATSTALPGLPPARLDELARIADDQRLRELAGALEEAGRRILELVDPPPAP